MFVTEDDQNLKQLANLKYLTEKWNEQPMFFRGAFETVYQNVSRALVDPLNLVGGLLYGQFAKAARKKAFQKILSDQIKKQTAKKVSVGEASIEASKAANKAKLIGAVEGGFKVAGIDAALMGTADIVIQNTEKQLGMREALDPFRVGTAAVTGGVFSFASTAGVAYSISKIGTGSQTKLPKSIKESLPKPAKEGINITEENNKLQQVNQRTVLKKFGDFVQLYGFNKFHEVDNLTKIGTGTGADVFSLKQAIKEAKVGDTDPSLLPAFRFRDTLASSARTKEFLEWRAFLPPDKDARPTEFNVDAYLKMRYKPINLNPPTYDNPKLKCEHLDGSVYVNSEGELFPCCYHGFGHVDRPKVHLKDFEKLRSSWKTSKCNQVCAESCGAP